MIEDERSKNVFYKYFWSISGVIPFATCFKHIPYMYSILFFIKLTLKTTDIESL